MIVPLFIQPSISELTLTAVNIRLRSPDPSICQLLDLQPQSWFVVFNFPGNIQAFCLFIQVALKVGANSPDSAAFRVPVFNVSLKMGIDRQI
jgi:hypothetical protein